MAKKSVRSSPDPEASKRSSVDWRGRQRKQRLVGIIKLFVFVVILGALTGAGIVYKNKIARWLNPPKQARRARKKKRVAPQKKLQASVKIEQPAAPKKVEPVKPVEVKRAPPPPPKRAFVEAEEKRAHALLSEGRKELARTVTVQKNGAEFQTFDFAGAKKKFQEAALLKASRKTHDAAVEWVKKAGEFELATRHIRITAFATEEATYRLALISGREMRGLKVEENDDFFKIQAVPEHNPATLGKSRLSIPKNQIAKTSEVKLGERQAEFRRLLAELESGAPLGQEARAEDYYDLVFLSKRLGLGAECVEFLEHAYAKAPQGLLGNAFRKLVVDRAIARASVQAAAGRKYYAQDELRRLLRTLPNYAYAQNEKEAFEVQVLSKMKKSFKSTLKLAAKKSVPDAAHGKKPVRSARELASEASGQAPAQEIVVDSSGVRGSGKAAKLVEQGNKEFAEGMKFYRQFRQGTKGRNNEVLHKAAKHLGKAVDLYGEALELNPNNTAVENRQQEANMIRYGAMKYLTL